MILGQFLKLSNVLFKSLTHMFVLDHNFLRQKKGSLSSKITGTDFDFLDNFFNFVTILMGIFQSLTHSVRNITI